MDIRSFLKREGRRTGIILILVGFCMPLVLYFFTIGFDLKDMELVLLKGRKVDRYGHRETKGRIAIPYKIPLALGIILVFVGVGKILLCGKYDFKLNPNPKEGLCHIIENGKECTEKADRRGLCMRHYQVIWQRSDLDIRDFAQNNSGDIRHN